MQFRNGFLILAIILIKALLICDVSAQQNLKIACSKCSGSEGYQRYVDWLHRADSSIMCFDLYILSIDSAMKTLNLCDGLMLTGGPDVHPGHYGAGYDMVRCKMDVRRDTLEFALIRRAAEMDLPILGICRGLQILNVAYGGSLIVDIPEDAGDKVIHRTAGDICTHGIHVDSSSSLFSLTQTSAGTVNSFHHQAIKEVSREFLVSAYANDGLPEAIERKNAEGKPFLMAVQWHPERMDYNSPFSGSILGGFLAGVREYQKERMLNGN